MNGFGLYSFPKSGNTWIRDFLSKILQFRNIQNDAVVKEFSQFFPEVYATEINDDVAIHVDSLEDDFIFYKSHDKFSNTHVAGKSINTKFVIYIIRNPLDVFISQANYLTSVVSGNFSINHSSVDDILSSRCMDLYLSSFILYGTLQPEFTSAGSWFDNVAYWMSDAPERDHGIQVIRIRYEDLVLDFFAAIDKVAKILGFSDDQLLLCYNFTKESTLIDNKFFWKQKVDNYKDYLSDTQIKKFVKYHGSKCANLGYFFDC